MHRACEVCGAQARGRNRLRRFLYGQRIVALCAEHAEMVKASGKATIAELRARFREEAGRRSMVSRRSPLDRRVFPARPEGRRRRPGRRASDHE